MKTNDFLLGVVAGAVVAASTVILTTPKAGSDVRLNIKNQSTVVKNQLADVKLQTTHVKQSLTTLKNEVKNNIPTIIIELKTALELFRKDIEPNLGNLQNEVNALNGSLDKIKENTDNFNKKKANPTIN